MGIFGTWRNAILAAGIPLERIRTGEQWSPPRILAQIRVLARRRRPLTTHQLDLRHRNLVAAARRHFGSWSKAILAAGIDPTALQRVVPWNQQRVIEAILTRALRGESLVARLIEPRSLPDAGYRFFGSWRAAVVAAGLSPATTEMPPRRKKRGRQRASAPSTDHHKRTYGVWSRERVVECIQARIRSGQPVNANAVMHDFPRLYAAALRHIHSWDEAMRSAGLDPDAHRRKRSSPCRRTLMRASESHRDHGFATGG